MNSTTPRLLADSTPPVAAATPARGPARIAAPEPPVPPNPHGFPLMATLAPVLVSIGLWLLTQSVFALLFAVLGPVVAVSSLADGRVQARRRLRRERERFAAELVVVGDDIDAAHGGEREAASAAQPSALVLAGGGWPDSELWRDRPGAAATRVRLGTGDRPSAVEFDSTASARRADPGARAALAGLAERAATLHGAPVFVDAALGIGVVGRPVVANALARAIVLQLGSALPPHSVRIELRMPARDAALWNWLDDLPHPVRREPADDVTVLSFSAVEEPPGTGTGRAAGAPLCLVAVADDRRRLPSSARVVVEVRGGGARVVQHPERGMLGELRTELVSAEQCRVRARALSGAAERAGLPTEAAGLPHLVRYAEIARTPGPSSLPEPGRTADTVRPAGAAAPARRGASLGCAVARTAHGTLRLDLVAHGPHAVVGGTTGSGKSELLVSWLLAMAEAHSPRELSVLLVDFKGGSAFAALEPLPHCVGMITDLDDATALRALESLAAELRRRERHLAQAGARSVDDLAGAEPGLRLPRLVIVVDEFAAMVAGFPDLHALFSDIAARGRSLGVHLVLCTQRPAGVIRDAVLANSALRISLRVNNRADSSAVVGTDAAAALPANPRGRALVSVDGEEPRAAQFPLVSRADIERVAASWAHDRYRAHRPWLDPLPAAVRLADLPVVAAHGPGHLPDDGPAIPFGLLDDPAHQRQPVAVYRPAVHGSLLVVGGSRSGKSVLLDTLGRAAHSSLLLPADVEGAWDTLVELAAAVSAAAPAPSVRQLSVPELLLVDDIDVLLGRFPEEYEAAVVSLLARILREGPARGLRSAISAQRLPAALHAVAALCGSRLLLRLPSRQEHVIAGGDASAFVERARPGEGSWQGLRLQVARADDAEVARPVRSGEGAPPPSPRARLDPGRPVAAVSADPARFASALARALPAFAAPGHIAELGRSGPPPEHIAVSSGPRPVAIVGDIDDWQAHWGAIAALRTTHQVVVDGYAAADFRAVTRLRELPPPIAAAGAAGPAAPPPLHGPFWLLAPDGSVRRAVLDHPSATPAQPPDRGG